MGDIATASRTWPLLAARHSALLGRPPGGPRRCLFGPPDHDATARWQEQQFRARAREERERWDFDFERGQPLPPGRYDWKRAADPRRDAEKNGGEVGELVQRRITDFMRKRKLTPAAEKKDLPEGPSRKMSRRSST